MEDSFGKHQDSVVDELPKLSGIFMQQDGLTLSKTLSTSASSNESAAMYLLPASRIEQSGIVLKSAAAAFAPAVADSLIGVDHVNLPGNKSIPIPKILESAAVGAAIGFASRTLLPQTGILGKAGSAALAVAFTAPLLKEGHDVYKGISHAKTVEELQKAGADLGRSVGTLAAGLPVGIASFKAGISAADNLMSRPSASGFLAAKSDFYGRANEWTANKINDTAEAAKRILIGERNYPGSHGVAEQYPRISESLKNGLKGTDYPLPTVKLEPGTGKGSNVLVVTGHGVEAPEFTEVVRAMRNAGANVTVATPDWTWDYQPGNRGKVSLAQWQVNERTLQADISVSTASQMISAGKFDAVYVPGGAGNTAAIRTDAGVQNLIKQSFQQQMDVWTICHGGQVFISALPKDSGIKLTGSPDITPQDLPNHGFVVPKDNVVFDSGHKLLSGKDPSVLNEFITAIGERFKAIQAEKATQGNITSANNRGPIQKEFTPDRYEWKPDPEMGLSRLLARTVPQDLSSSSLARLAGTPYPSAFDLRPPGPAPSYPRGPFPPIEKTAVSEGPVHKTGDPASLYLRAMRAMERK